MQLDPQTLIFVGFFGLGLGSLLLSIFLYRRLSWGLRRLVKTDKAPTGIVTSLRNLILIFLLLASSGMLLPIGLFSQAYHRFSHEIPVAEVITRPLGKVGSLPVSQVRYRPAGNSGDRFFILTGDQWIIEGDIIKWKPWLNLLGLDTRYRLTRLQGRHLDIETERSAPRTICSLVENRPGEQERHPVWRFLYRSGQKLPLVDTVYGNAAYQDLSDPCRYHVFVGPTGFLVRKAG